MQPHYKDHRYSEDPIFTAYWRTSEASHRPKLRPHRGVTISLEGVHVDGVDRLNKLYVRGASVPLEGWAADVAIRRIRRATARCNPL